MGQEKVQKNIINDWMMVFYTRQRILFSLIFSILFSVLQGQDLFKTLGLADQKYDREDYKGALIDYQRVLFFSEKNEAIIFEKIGNCYFQMNDYSKAEKNYDYAYFQFSNDSLKKEMIFKKVACFILSKKFHLGLVEMYNLDDSLSVYFHEKRSLYQGVCYWGLENFESSRNHFTNLLVHDQTAIEQLNKLFTKQYINRPNPKTAKLLSIVFPGSGQIYAGDLKNGINSILLTDGLIVLFVITGLNYSFLDAVISVLPWLQRYYQGGYTSAEKIATHKRNINREQTFKEILALIEKVENKD